jgi:hypothetical protein
MIPKSLLKTLSAPFPGSNVVEAVDEVPAEAKALLAEVAELASVLPKEQFFREIWQGINLANTIHQIQHGSFGARRRSVRELNRLAKIGGKYADTLKACSAHTAFLLSTVRPHLNSLIKPDLSHLADFVAELSSATKDATEAQTAGQQRLAFKQLVFALLDAVERGGGNLTLDDTGIGTLVVALEKLREATVAGHQLLSPRLIPEPSPGPSLRQIRDSWIKGRSKNASVPIDSASGGSNSSAFQR